MLTDTLRQAAATISAPEDPWPGFARRERLRRRTRRVRRTALAVVVAAAVGVQTNVVPLPGWAPGIALASPWSALASAPPRGSLTGDTAWVAAFRDRVTGLQDPDGFWAVAGRERIKVLYASDAPGRRVALVLVPLRFGFVTSWELIWYDGPAGAAPSEMTYAGNQDAGDPVVTLSQVDGQRGGYALVIGPPDTTVTISGDPRYAARGVVERRELARSDGGGVGVVLLPPAPLPPGLDARVTRGSSVVYSGAVFGGWGSSADGDPFEPPAGQLASAVVGSRGPAPDPAILTSFVRLALTDSHLPASGTTVRLRWSGSVNGQAAVLLTVQPSGGGVVAYALHGSATSSRTDLRLLLPAAGAELRPIAWRLRAEGGDGRTDRVLVATPTGTARAAMTAGGGSPVPVTLDGSGFGTTAVPPDQQATVTAYAADGSLLGSTPVPPFENNSSRLPGDTPGTRIVP
ncbi:hypothetical protein Ais01nite_63610 [Asanoa ishikariensis]|uniref:Uncharacterized protein n=1 Tax=Asanoa ishikariensis TaxID=137265 RepID=A0A1H3NV57_9ACTN|nr:hypothetical protein [Asanoa ishikariensis]GIF68326.1 hypothetical protein Ais01nite_63610 [Asanoa ishikariensis]SDY92821.1 hypothetical protein SAMN05421684_2362 [Asanoa ishikariensis]